MVMDTPTEKKTRRAPTGPRRVNPYTVIAVVTDASGNPVEGAKIDVQVFSKDPAKVLRALREYRNSPGVVTFDYTPSAVTTE